MATWVRTLTGVVPQATDGDVTGTIELDNATAPGDFDPDAVNSVRFQSTTQRQAGTWDDDSHTVWNEIQLTLNGNGSVLASVNGANDTLQSGTDSVSEDATDSSIPTGFTTAQWEGAEVNPGPTNTVWTTFNQNMMPDGVTVRVNVMTVTIDYTPGAAARRSRRGACLRRVRKESGLPRRSASSRR